MDFLKKLFYSEGKEKDPVCGMSVDPKTAAFKSEHNGKRYFFCSANCKQQFDQDPNQYM